MKIEPNKDTGIVALTMAIPVKLLKKSKTIKAAKTAPTIKFCPKPLINE